VDREVLVTTHRRKFFVEIFVDQELGICSGWGDVLLVYYFLAAEEKTQPHSCFYTSCAQSVPVLFSFGSGEILFVLQSLCYLLLMTFADGDTNLNVSPTDQKSKEISFMAWPTDGRTSRLKKSLLWGGTDGRMLRPEMWDSISSPWIRHKVIQFMRIVRPLSREQTKLILP